MLRFFEDPLLSFTRGLLRLFYRLAFLLAAILVIAGLGAAIGILAGHVPEAAKTYDAQEALMLALAPLVLGIYGWFARLLAQIIDTVAAGDAFIRINAERLKRMAWLMLAMKLLVSVQDPVLNALFRHEVHSPFQYPSGGLIFPLTLFILARVFRQGAEMRDDLEGTV